MFEKTKFYNSYENWIIAKCIHAYCNFYFSLSWWWLDFQYKQKNHDLDEYNCMCIQFWVNFSVYEDKLSETFMVKKLNKDFIRFYTTETQETWYEWWCLP